MAAAGNEAAVAGGAAGGGAAAAPAPAMPMWQRMLNMLTMYMLVSFIATNFLGIGKNNMGPTTTTTSGGGGKTQQQVHLPAGTVKNLWPEGASMQLSVSFTAYYPPIGQESTAAEAINSTLLALTPEERAEQEIVAMPNYEHASLGSAEFVDLKFVNTDEERSLNVTLDVLDCQQRNCTIVADIQLHTDAPAVVHEEDRTRRFRTLVTGWYDHHVTVEKNLFDDDSDDDVTPGSGDEKSMDEVTGSEQEKDEDRIVHFVKPAILLNTVADFTALQVASLPDILKKHFKYVPDRTPGDLKKEASGRFSPDEDFNEDTDKEEKEVSGGDGEAKTASAEEEEELPAVQFTDRFYPIIYINDFWTLKDQLKELNTSTVQPGVNSTVNLTIQYYPLSFFKFMMYTSMENSFDQQEQWGTMEKGGRDTTKKMFIETNPILLGVTVVVSLLHLVFEYLAFSNDVKFWKGKKNFKGLSLQGLLVNCYFQTVIFLYLLDSEKTSWTVVLPTGVGVLIEFWKLRKVVSFIPKEAKDILPNGTILQRLPFRIEFAKSYEGKTKKYDRVALKWLFIVGTPCLLAYTIYSAMYHNYKGWYSFAIRTQVRFIYFSGFAMMCPQIYINYKLKCVAHMPWRTFTYKALNTVIDDLFAFIITMPTMHRLACFRDDVVFLILLYQRWIYPVNEKLTEDGDLPETDDEAEEEEQKKIENEEKKVDEVVGAISAKTSKKKEKVESEDEAPVKASQSNATKASPRKRTTRKE